MQRRGTGGDEPPVLHLHAAGGGIPGGSMSRGHAEPRDRGDARQGLPPEAIGKDVF